MLQAFEHPDVPVDVKIARARILSGMNLVQACMHLCSFYVSGFMFLYVRVYMHMLMSNWVTHCLLGARGGQCNGGQKVGERG